MQSLELFYADTLFRLSNLGWLGVIDLVLVAFVFFVLLTQIRRSQAAFMLRGVLVLGMVLLMITIFLPLPTFDWMVRGALLVMLVATPVVLQPELRRMLERIGRSTGLSRAVRQTTAESVLPRLLRSVDALAASRTGALIVLEGDDVIQNVIDTGIPVDSRITEELLQTIFFDKTPLHDGAMVVRGDRIVAASCVLPLTEQAISSYRRLGTRHRAAVGMSEKSDALVIVVSEETGHISVAHQGELHQRLDSTALRQRVYDFYTGDEEGAESLSLRQLAIQGWYWLRQQGGRPSSRQWLTGLGMLLMTAVFTLTLWSFVVDQTNPTARPRVDGIPLRVEDIPEGTTLMTTPPSDVSALVRTTANLQPNLQADNFQAAVSLAGLAPGPYQLPVEVTPGLSPAQIVSVEPPIINVELAAIISHTLPVTVDIPDRESLSVAYEIIGQPKTLPQEVTVTGPEPLVAQVDRVQASLSVLNATTTIQQTRPLRAVDENGREVTGVTIEPDQAQVTLTINRRRNARDVGVRAVTEGSPPEGYWLSSLTAVPNNVTLQGPPDILAGLNGYVDTLPVDVSEAIGPLTVQVPLDLPQEITATDSSGVPVRVVTVTAQIEARTGDMVVTRSIKLLGTREGVTTEVEPTTVDLLLSGPLPVLREIEANPEMVQVVVDIARLAPISGQSYEVTPEVTAPNDVQAQLTPTTVLVTMSR